jgi:hypothetical protein
VESPWEASFLKKTIILGSFLLSVSCSDIFNSDTDGQYTVRIPVNGSDGKYSLRDVKLKSVTDIKTLANTTVTIKARGQMKSMVDREGRHLLSLSDYGDTPRPHFLKSQGVLIPADYHTLVLATVVYQFEHLKSFFDELGANGGLKFPRLLLLDVGEGPMKDNAQYVSGLDIFVINPYKSDLLPSYFNAGLLAHEYFHSIFIQQLKSIKETHLAKGEITSDEAKDLGFLELSSDDFKDGFACANDFDFASINEGIADFFGYAFTKDPEFGMASFAPEISKPRSLDSEKPYPFAPWGTEEGFVYWTLSQGKKGPCAYDPHVAGASIARLLYLFSQSWGLNETTQTVLSFVNQYTDLYSINRQRKYMGLRSILPLFLGERTLDENLCPQAEKVFPSNQIQWRGCETKEIPQSEKASL